ncbi:hypothetical protein KIW84_065862 [Lathyrus oleraceus]|uniref:Uncharacterized protein n=1 Tax=Pisum sativum TaxID=3888 RepID=A0A9D4WG92_PEA|nr:hypothetical protein KIW84_065862 [Pisum sativum]
MRKGTNGGVTKAGLLAAAADGSVIGLSYVLLEFSTIKCGSESSQATTGNTHRYHGRTSFITSSSSVEDSWADSSGLMFLLLFSV